MLFRSLTMNNGSLDRELKELQEIISKKDRSIIKLKTLLQRSVDSDNRKQEQIGHLQAQITELNEVLTNYTKKSTAGDSHSVINENMSTADLLHYVTTVEQEKEKLKSKLDSLCPDDLIQKNQKLEQMIEKSNNLYIQAQEEIERLKKENEHLMPLKTKNSGWTITKPTAISSITPNLIRATKTSSSNDSLNNTYLKSTLIQFFVQDADKRSTLIPIILELVGCNEQQIKATQRQWDRSNQLIQKTTGFFGF